MRNIISGLFCLLVICQPMVANATSAKNELIETIKTMHISLERDLTLERSFSSKAHLMHNFINFVNQELERTGLTDELAKIHDEYRDELSLYSAAFSLFVPLLNSNSQNNCKRKNAVLISSPPGSSKVIDESENSINPADEFTKIANSLIKAFCSEANNER